MAMAVAMDECEQRDLGRTAVRSEWRLIATTHNILKLHHLRLTATTP